MPASATETKKLRTAQSAVATARDKIRGVNEQITATERRRDQLQSELAAALAAGADGDKLETELAKIAARLKAYVVSLAALESELVKAQAAEFLAEYDHNAGRYSECRAQAAALNPAIEQARAELDKLLAKRNQISQDAHHFFDKCIAQVTNANRTGFIAETGIQPEIDAIYKAHFNQ